MTVVARLNMGFGVLLLLMVLLVLIGIFCLPAVEDVALTLINKDQVVADAINDVDTLTYANGLATIELVVNKDTNRAREIRRQVAANKGKIGVIDGIAFQTNILALDTAVEAAGAGQKG